MAVVPDCHAMLACSEAIFAVILSDANGIGMTGMAVSEILQGS